MTCHPYATRIAVGPAARRGAFALVLLLWFAPHRPAAAQQPHSTATATAMPRFDAEAATQAYLDRLTPEQRARSDAYFQGGYWLILWNFIASGAIAVLLLGSGWSVRFRNWAERRSRFPPLQTLLYWTCYLVSVSVLALPLSVYEGYVREHHYGLSTQSFRAWLGDELKGLVLGIVLGGLALAVLYEVLRRAPRTWWLWGSAVAALFAVTGVLIAPVFIAPVFNRYTPLQDPAVRDPILRMARANGIQATEVYEVDASRQSTRISANVSGLFGTERISLNDNLLRQGSTAEIEAVMGHEMGHYVLHHAYWGLLYFSLVLFGGFGFARWAFARASARWGRTWNLRGIADPAGLPLLSLIGSLYFFVLSPLNNTVSRTIEAEADIFGLNASGQPDAFATVELKLSEYRRLDPGPLEEWIFYDHPSGRRRILAAMRWKAEHLP